MTDPQDYGALYESAREALRDGTAKNPVVVTVRSRSKGSFESRVACRDHTIVSDQPFGFGGGNTGPKPSELLLAALAACQEVTWRLYANAQGIEIHDISVELTGTQDLNGFLGLDPDTPPGFQRIEGTVTVESPASEDELRELQKAVDARCPVLDDLIRAVPVALKVAKSP